MSVPSACPDETEIRDIEPSQRPSTLALASKEALDECPSNDLLSGRSKVRIPSGRWVFAEHKGACVIHVPDRFTFLRRLGLLVSRARAVSPTTASARARCRSSDECR